MFFYGAMLTLSKPERKGRGPGRGKGGTTTQEGGRGHIIQEGEGPQHTKGRDHGTRMGGTTAQEGEGPHHRKGRGHSTGRGGGTSQEKEGPHHRKGRGHSTERF